MFVAGHRRVGVGVPVTGLAAVLAGALLAAGCTAGGGPAPGPTRPGTSGIAPGTSGPGTSGPGTSVPSTPDAALRPFYTQRLTWTPCGEPFQCSRLRVPVDYAAPSGPTIELALVRLPATDPARRLGSLLVNPGGPGASGVEYARAAQSAITAAVRERYDVVGFDPRGVGASAPVRCQSAAETDAWLAADGSPDTPAEEQRLEALATALATRCAQRGGALLAHMGSADVARDMDVLRAALGDPKLAYLGKSYGTYLGATYAELFPTRVGRLVLDGALDPRLSAEQLAAGQAAGFEQALRAFAADCVARGGCPLGGGVPGVLATVDRVLAAADRAPLPSRSGRPVTQSLVVLGIALPLYDHTAWPELRQALTEAAGGDGTSLLLFADIYTGRQADGSYRDNSNDAIYAVNCLDHPDTETLPQVRADAAALTRVSARFGAYLAWSDRPCVRWPVPPETTPHAIRAEGAAPILVVGTTRDPATPYAWAQGLAAQLATGVLLTYDGDGHTAYAQGSACVDRVVETYLVDGTPPAPGTRC